MSREVVVCHHHYMDREVVVGHHHCIGREVVVLPVHVAVKYFDDVADELRRGYLYLHQ